MSVTKLSAVGLLSLLLAFICLFVVQYVIGISVLASEGGEAVIVPLVVKNIGPQSARILNIKTSCNCSKAWAETTEIPAFGTAKIWLKVNTLGQRGLAPASVICETSSAFRRIVVSNVKINVQPVARILRGNGYFGNVNHSGIPISRMIYLDFDNAVNGVLAKSESGLCGVVLKRDIDDSGLFVLTITLSESAAGSIKDNVDLIDSKGKRVLSIPVMASVIK